ncbi:MAG TPA: hypothetical protein VJL81_12265 [Solirubrobacterales bacterium]|nr:hypothetical protein [Solirubrobacterales bacterium]
MPNVFEKLSSDSSVEHSGRFWEIRRRRSTCARCRPAARRCCSAGFTPSALNRVGARGAGWIAIAGAPEEFEEQLWGMASGSADDLPASGEEPIAILRG